jgi:hypothetical protein
MASLDSTGPYSGPFREIVTVFTALKDGKE